MQWRLKYDQSVNLLDLYHDRYLPSAREELPEMITHMFKHVYDDFWKKSPFKADKKYKLLDKQKKILKEVLEPPGNFCISSCH